jgi:hypothetical protein
MTDDLTLLLLHPPLPYGEWEWWWSKVMGSEEVREEGGAVLEQTFQSERW